MDHFPDSQLFSPTSFYEGLALPVDVACKLCCLKRQLRRSGSQTSRLLEQISRDNSSQESIPYESCVAGLSARGRERIRCYRVPKGVADCRVWRRILDCSRREWVGGEGRGGTMRSLEEEEDASKRAILSLFPRSTTTNASRG